jgi:hypothetical protein
VQCPGWDSGTEHQVKTEKTGIKCGFWLILVIGLMVVAEPVDPQLWSTGETSVCKERSVLCLQLFCNSEMILKLQKNKTKQSRTQLECKPNEGGFFHSLVAGYTQIKKWATMFPGPYQRKDCWEGRWGLVREVGCGQGYIDFGDLGAGTASLCASRGGPRKVLGVSQHGDHPWCLHFSK